MEESLKDALKGPSPFLWRGGTGNLRHCIVWKLGLRPGSHRAQGSLIEHIRRRILLSSDAQKGSLTYPPSLDALKSPYNAYNEGPTNKKAI